MSAIANRFNKAQYGIILPYHGGNYEAYIAPSDSGVTVHYHKAHEAMPAFDSDEFPSIEKADEFLSKELRGIDQRKIRNFSPENEW